MNLFHRTPHFSLLALALCLALCGCIHNLGNANVSGEMLHTAGKVDTGKAIYVALADPLPPDLADTPAFITAQFCKYLSPVVSSISAGEAAQSPEAALREARKEKSDYLALLRLLEWKNGSLTAIGSRVRVEASIIDTSTGNVLSQRRIEAKCYAMAMGLEASPRECVRPQVEKWMQQVFGAPAGTAPHTDLATLPR